LSASVGLVGLAAMPYASLWAQEPPHDVTFAEDFDELWRTLGERYCFFGEKTTDWNAVRQRYRPAAVAAASRDAFAGCCQSNANRSPPDAPRALRLVA
jgi:carboxyl-terminal processing protease